MSKPYAAPLDLAPRSSPRLAALLAAALAGALLLPLSVSLPGWGRVVAVFVAFGLGWQGWRGAFGGRRITRAVWDETGAWHIERADGTAMEAELDGESLISPGAMILGFRTEQGRHYLVVLADTLDAEVRRRLRVRLRLEGARAAGEKRSVKQRR